MKLDANLRLYLRAIYHKRTGIALSKLVTRNQGDAAVRLCKAPLIRGDSLSNSWQTAAILCRPVIQAACSAL